mmetsp:Transcript_15336/g.26978  ORF Transcript_15336/g.26978 Transcript_15336/m.26978 type:complete len:545 (-) Transcript_15336:62-1696(-)
MRAQASRRPSKKIANACESLECKIVGESGVSKDEAVVDVTAIVQIALRRRVTQVRVGGIGFLVDVAIQLALTTDYAKTELPFLLFEDLFYIETVDKYKDAWQLVEDRTKVLTGKEMMPYGKVTKAKMAMLRIANFLLRRLSASHHTVLCGRVMMFLAYAFPLSERSGVNLLGAYNDLNVTEFEDEEEFKSSRTIKISEEEKIGGGAEISEKAVNYTLYEKFWTLQRFFLVKADKVQHGCVSSPAKWNEFWQVADVVLSAFESKPFSQADLDRELSMWRESRKHRKSQDMDVDMIEQDEQSRSDRFFPTKYLSSSRLLSLQLSDPTLRRNVLVQFAFLLRSIGSLTTIKPTVRAKLNDKGNGLETLRRRIFSLLRATPPDGESFIRDLNHVMKREENWVQWKTARCPNFERFKDEEDDKVTNKLNDEEQARKRAKTSQFARIRSKVQSNQQLWRSKVSTWQDDFSKGTSNATPDVNDFLKDMEVAIDPENCIEEDYHPKNDPVYCWRGFRLLARDRLDVVEHALDGSLENACKHIVEKKKSLEAH